MFLLWKSPENTQRKIFPQHTTICFDLSHRTIKPKGCHDLDIIRLIKLETKFFKKMSFSCADRLLIASVCVIVIFIACANGNYESRESDPLSEGGGERTPQEGNDCATHNCMKRTINSAPGSMWFGPRLGRRRRSGQKALNFRQIEAVSEDKETAKFTPRLGRELAEEILFGDFEDIPDQIDKQDFYDEIRPKPIWIFRKGREVPFLPIPRLG